jgi:hypothetical protein
MPSLPQDIEHCQYKYMSNSLAVASPAETAACCSPLTAEPLELPGSMASQAPSDGQPGPVRWPARPRRGSGSPGRPRRRSSAATPGGAGMAAICRTWQGPAAVVTWWLAATRQHVAVWRASSRQGGPSRNAGTHPSGPPSSCVNEAAALPITGGYVARPARPGYGPASGATVGLAASGLTAYGKVR